MLTVPRRPNRYIGGIIVAAVAAIGVVSIVVVHAVGNPLAIEPENGSLTGPASVTTNALASGGKSVKFGAPSGATTTGSLALLRINPNEALPADLSRYTMLILDGGRAGQVAGLKAKYPNLRILGYKNLSFAVDYSTDNITGNAGVPWALASSNPSWFLTDSGGNRVTSVNFSTSWFMDLGSSSYQDGWYTSVLAFLKSAPWDGVFMDDTNPDPSWHLGGNYAKLAKYPTRDAYRAATRSMLASIGPRLKAAGYMAIPNVGASWDQPDVWADFATLTSGAMREFFLRWGSASDGLPVFINGDWKLHTDVERSVINAGRTFVALTYGATTDSSQERYIRASFLLFWQPATGSVSMWSPNDGSDFQAELGLPLGAASQNGNVWTRQFEKGSVTVDTAAATATVAIK